KQRKKKRGREGGEAHWHDEDTTAMTGGGDSEEKREGRLLGEEEALAKHTADGEHYASDSKVLAANSLAFSKAVKLAGDGKDAWVCYLLGVVWVCLKKIRMKE
ncbi:hypothetical protein Tsubulata_037293, partial [Turnera subulata]